jgi:hypothetical protein
MSAISNQEQNQQVLESLIQSPHAANSTLTASNCTFAPRGTKGSRNQTNTNQESCFINPKKIIKQEKLTSSTKTLPGRGGKASNPDALLRIRICLPFLALCPERKREPQRKSGKGCEQIRKNRLRGSGGCLRRIGDWGTAREGRRRTTGPRRTAKERWRCGSCTTPWKWEGGKEERGGRGDGMKWEGFIIRFFFRSLLFVF